MHSLPVLGAHTLLPPHRTPFQGAIQHYFSFNWHLSQEGENHPDHSSSITLLASLSHCTDHSVTITLEVGSPTCLHMSVHSALLGFQAQHP